MDGVIRRTRRALAEFRVEGVRSNIAFLQALLKQADVAAGTIHTRYVEEHMATLLDEVRDRPRHFSPERDVQQAGVKVDPDDPLAVLNVPRADAPAPAVAAVAAASPRSSRVPKAPSRCRRRSRAWWWRFPSRRATSCRRASRSPCSKRSRWST